MLDHTHDPAATSWVPVPAGSDFPIQNLPLGLFRCGEEAFRPGIAIGDHILDLIAARDEGLLPAEAADAVARAAEAGALNALLTPAPRKALRLAAFALLQQGSAASARAERLLRPLSACALELPVRIGDYTDFYAGIHHARTVGSLFRPDNPLLPNYKYVPIGYHGRASTVRPSGTAVIRPRGQLATPSGVPEFAPCRRLDFELEMGLWIDGGNAPGRPIPIGQAGAHIAGLCLLNDWSARDVQAWEYQPLGPFLAKSFLTTVSPWIVTAEALAPFRIPQPPRPEGDPEPLPYLLDAEDQASGSFAIDLTVSIRTAKMRAAGLPPHALARSRMADLYWTAAQLLAHHSSNGCLMQAGDLLGTGTISGAEPGTAGSLLEITRGGAEPLPLPNGEERRFLEDGDEIALSGRATAPGRVPIGFGPCTGIVAPALG